MKMQIKEFAEITGVSVRTLHYYDEINLLKPAIADKITGYRFYNEQSVLRMQEILFFRELDFSLKSIKEILSSPDYDKQKALTQQKQLLIIKKERLEKLIFAIDEAAKGENVMNAFDNSKFDQYKQEVKEKWGSTDAYRECSQKTRNYSKEKWNGLTDDLNGIFGDFAQCRKNGHKPDSDEAQNIVKTLQNHITENFYHCSTEILAGLGQMYVCDERFKTNIDSHGDGTAEFASRAISIYCNGK